MQFILYACTLFTLSYTLCNAEEFPLVEFFKTATDDFVGTALDNVQVKNSYLCPGGCCECSKTCMLTRTCCIDKLWNATQPEPLNEYIDRFQAEIDNETFVMFECPTVF